MIIIEFPTDVPFPEGGFREVFSDLFTPQVKPQEDHFRYTIYGVAWGKKKRRYKFFFDRLEREEFATKDCDKFEFDYDDLDDMLDGINRYTTGQML